MMKCKKFLWNLKILGAAEIFYQGVNLEKSNEIKAMFENIVKEFGKIDILVNNAGIQHVAPIDEFPEDELEQILRIDLISSFYKICNSYNQKERLWAYCQYRFSTRIRRITFLNQPMLQQNTAYLVLLRSS